MGKGKKGGLTEKSGMDRRLKEGLKSRNDASFFTNGFLKTSEPSDMHHISNSLYVCLIICIFSSSHISGFQHGSNQETNLKFLVLATKFQA